MNRIHEIESTDYVLSEEFTRRVCTPALVIYLDFVRENLNRVIELLDGRVDRWRPHVKTTKLPPVFAELARAGVRGFKCATLREADHLSLALAQEGVVGADILVAYPLIGPALEGLGQLASTRPETRFSVLCEDPDAVESVAAEVDLFADVNSGMDRTGVPLEDRARVLEIARRAAGRFRGLHFYDGHLTQPDPAQRREAVFACYDRLGGLVNFLTESRVRVAELVTSGTPAFLSALEYRGFDELPETVHRFSPGTVVFHDLRSEEESEGLRLKPAALVLTRVVSHPREDRVTCDAGSKSIAAEAGDPCALVLGHPELMPLRPSEEHLPLSVRRGPLPPRGTELLLVPRHVCPTVNLAEQAILVEAGEVREIAPVSARAHDLLLGVPKDGGTSAR
jgi:D-serine deaminase-like pyridoxal phosphate-dependent protein